MSSLNLFLVRTERRYRDVHIVTVRYTASAPKGAITSASGRGPFLCLRAWPRREVTQVDLHLPQETGSAIPQKKNIKY